MNIEVDFNFCDADIKAIARNFSRCLNKNLRTAMILIAVFGAVTLVLNISDGSFGFAECVLAAVVITAGVWLAVDPIEKKMIKANSNLLGNHCKLAFYEDYFYEKYESPLRISEDSVRYEIISAAYETDTHFILYTQTGICYCFAKRYLSQDDYFMLHSFLTARLGFCFKNIK